MRPIRRGDRGPAVDEIRSILIGLDLLRVDPASAGDAEPAGGAAGAFGPARKADSTPPRTVPSGHSSRAVD